MAAILAVVNQAPSSVFFGTAPEPIAEHAYQRRLSGWLETAPIATLTEGS